MPKLITTAELKRLIDSPEDVRKLAEELQEGVWKHDLSICRVVAGWTGCHDWKCHKCKQEWNMTKEQDIISPCSVPDPIDKPLEVMAFEERWKAVANTNNWLPTRMTVAQIAVPELFESIHPSQYASITDCWYMSTAPVTAWLLAAFIAQGKIEIAGGGR
jgi:hypothetical protein